MVATLSGVLSPENAFAPMSCLFKLVFSNLPDDWNLTDRLNESFSLFSSIVKLASPLDVVNFFIHGDFENRESIQTPYGTIDSYAISTRLKSKLLQSDLSLRQLCILRMTEASAPHVTMTDVLHLPNNLFRTFMVTAFFVHWLPMTHIKFHPDLDEKQEVPSNLQCVFEFICNPRIFERMFNDCRDVLVFIVCWLQHTQFHEIIGENTTATAQSSTTPIHNPNYRPFLQPHWLSVQLIRTVKQLLLLPLRDWSLIPWIEDKEASLFPESSAYTSAEAQNSVLAAMRLGLKVASFLCDSSEYVYAVETTHLVCAHLHLIQQPETQTWLRYEAMCIMLRAMNTHSMYQDPKDQQIFLNDAPNLLLSMQNSGLLLRPRLNPQRPASYYVLPRYLAAPPPPPLHPTAVGTTTPAATTTTKSATSTSDTNPLVLTMPSVDEALDVVRKVRTEWVGDQTIKPLVPLGAGGSQYLGPAGDVPSIAPASDVLTELIAWKGSTYTVADCLRPASEPVRPQSFLSRRASSSSVCDDLRSSTPPESASSDRVLNGAFLYTQLATYHYTMCSYDVAYQFTLLAIEQFRACGERREIPSAQTVIEFLRIACKMCMIKRNYELGLEIIRFALLFTRHYYGTLNLTYANLLVEYGCLLLNTDKTRQAARVYRVGFALILNCLPGDSVMSALALEAIAYAHYVLEYTSGEFSHALKCAEVAILILGRLNRHLCMQWASANRVKALIIEEIAIDANEPSLTVRYLEEAKNLHMQSLELCKQTFGIYNIQTAKHFGNLGRLYQSMQDIVKAEKMHINAILIKCRLLGNSDFEVGLSLGHLASLYNYDLGRYEDAEKLYLGSIEISRRLFGNTYSGLEYDYRGLQRVYYQLGRTQDMHRYTELCRQWLEEREELRLTRTTNSHVMDELEPANEISGDPQLWLWSRFVSLLDKYEETFAPVFPGFDLSSASNITTQSSRQNTPSTSKLASTTNAEASRSTGY